MKKCPRCSGRVLPSYQGEEECLNCGCVLYKDKPEVKQGNWGIERRWDSWKWKKKSA